MDASTRKLLSSAAAEALGLGMICFFGCMGTLGEFHKSAIGLPHMQVALCFGLVVMVAIAVSTSLGISRARQESATTVFNSKTSLHPDTSASFGGG